MGTAVILVCIVPLLSNWRVLRLVFVLYRLSWGRVSYFTALLAFFLGIVTELMINTRWVNVFKLSDALFVLRVWR